MRNNKPKIIVILGPTASGKTSLAVNMAREFDGEIVSADSRQVFRGMDVGTGKDLAEYVEIKYHMIDVAEPMEDYSLAHYKSGVEKAIDDIVRRGKQPFLVGGSGLYLQSVVDNYALSEVGRDDGLREELEKLSVSDLFERLEKINPLFASKINESDAKNKRRLVRYIELQSSDQKSETPKLEPQKYECLVLGLDPGKEVVDAKIYKRLIDRLEKEDMVKEIDDLHSKGVTWQRLKDFGLEYRFVAEYLQEKIDYETMVERLNIAIRQFAKRQMTWFRRWEKQGRHIYLLNFDRKIEDARAKIQKFLS
ncbi:tRNA (adenosine(37)-N6)-dimethylallyltransferase MiaA [Candidatus Falkowbacteria bacterium]|nr:tRNA (adenosine(37)-N6)-dimethylallyltransferase MiaA [Candidatus Falkowbacteria bacterium]